MLLVLLVVLLAAAGGFLGDLLELAGWLVLVLVAIGALLGLALYGGYRKLRSRVT